MDGRPYLVCWLATRGKWKRGRLLPNVSSSQRYTALALHQGPAGTLQVVGLGEDGNPCLVCWQDRGGNWYPGMPLHGAEPDWIHVGPGEFHITRTDVSLSTNPALGFALSHRRNVPTVIQVVDNDGWPAALFGDGATWLTVMPGGPTYKLIDPSTKPGRYTFKTDKLPTRARPPQEPMPGTIEVSK